MYYQLTDILKIFCVCIILLGIELAQLKMSSTIYLSVPLW